MIELSKETVAVIDALFEGDEKEMMKNRLLEECSENIPFCDRHTPEEMERIRFSVIKLCSKDGNEWNYYFELAKTDWRDLFMSSGFAEEIYEHQRSKEEVLTSRFR